LHRTAYVGIRTWNERTRAKFYRAQRDGLKPRKQRSSATNPKEDWFQVPGAYTPIVSLELFERVQERLRSNKRQTSPTQGRPFYFTGLVYCGHCGRPMYGRQATSHGKTYRFYLCSGYVLSGPERCQLYSIREDLLMGHLRHTIAACFEAPDFLESIQRDWNAYNQQQAQDMPKKKQQLLRQQAALEQKIKRALRMAIEVDDLAPDFEAEVRIYKQQCEKITNELALIQDQEKQIQATEFEIQHLKELASRIKEILAGDDHHQIKEAIATLTERITLKFRRIPHPKRCLNQLIEQQWILRPMFNFSGTLRNLFTGFGLVKDGKPIKNLEVKLKP
jgi:hypothetical protein